MLKDIAVKFTATATGRKLHRLISEYRSQNIMPKRPLVLHIETTSLCNSKCIMCAHRIMKRQKKTMDDDLFEKIAVQASVSGIEWVNLQFYGEPLLDKNIFSRIKRLKTDGVKVRLNTNASLMNEKNIMNLIDSEIDQINISFDAFSEESYNRIRVGLNYNTTIRNIEEFIRIKEQAGSNIYLMMTFVSLEQNAHEADLFRKKWNRKADKALISFARDWAGQLQVRGKKSTLLSAETNICKSLWNDLVILQDGTAALCCSDYEGAGNMGNLNHQTIDEVWNGEKFVHYRKSHRENGRMGLDICKNCNYYSYWWIR